MILAEIIGPDLLIILAVVALLFGSSQLPKLARSLGSAKAEFERGLRQRNEAPADEPPAPDEQVTMTRAQLDALLAERDSSKDAPPPA